MKKLIDITDKNFCSFTVKRYSGNKKLEYIRKDIT